MRNIDILNATQLHQLPTLFKNSPERLRTKQRQIYTVECYKWLFCQCSILQHCTLTTYSYMIQMYVKSSSGLIMFPSRLLSYSPNSIRSYKIVQKLFPKHAAHGVAQSPYPIYRHGKACLSKQPPWRAAGDPRLAHGRSRVWAPDPVGALRTFFSPPSFLHLPHQTRGQVRVKVSECNMLPQLTLNHLPKCYL